MRADESVARQSFRFSPAWRKNAITDQEAPDIDRRLDGIAIKNGRLIVHSLSGNERNHLFLNREGRAFDDISVISGLDNPADGRGFVLWDYDHDGWQDIALVNANEPLLNLYHNEIGRLAPDAGTQKNPGAMIALRFVGGNRSGAASPQACRDGYGAMVVASLGDATLKREHRCGEGYATQNSATMILGIGPRGNVPKLAVRWPSGQSAATENVPPGTLLTVYENPAESPTGESFARRPYERARQQAPADPSSDRSPPTFPLADLDTAGSANGSPPAFRVYTTMATWCAACIEHIPEMRLLRSTLQAEGVDFIGVPVDETEDTAKLQSFVNKWNPAYDVLVTLPRERRQSVTKFLQELTRTPNPGVPSTVVTDGSGNVLLVGSGIPSVSVLRKVILNRKPRL